MKTEWTKTKRTKTEWTKTEWKAEWVKKFSGKRVLESVLLPLAAYLLTGTMIVDMGRISVPYAYFIVWAVMAGILAGVREIFQAKPVLVGTGIYAAVLLIWFLRFGEEDGRVHAVLMAVALALLIGLEIAGIGFSKGVIALAIILFLHSASETVSFFHSAQAPSFLVIYIMTACLTMLLPAPEEAYDWGFVVKTVRSVCGFADRMLFEVQYRWAAGRTDGVFHYRFTGYGEDASFLASGLADRDMVQLVIRGERTKRNLYLRGNICDSYTGSRWETKGTEETMGYQADTLMTLYAIFEKVQDEEELDRFMEVRQQKAAMEDIRTYSLFHPLKLLDIKVSDGKAEGDNLRTEKKMKKGDAYSYCFLDMDYANGKLKEIIQSGGSTVYEEETYHLIYDKLEEYYGVVMEELPFSVFVDEVAEGRERIRERYTDTGPAVSEEVRQLAGRITAGCVSDYEKCKALEAYLYRYHYNTHPDVPENENILDWFLFEGKEGYCVHYATAFASMLRCEGIPARLAEGFLVDYEDNPDLHTFSVHSNTAHVWVEAYLDGFGWMRLEPTAPNAEDANQVWYEETEKEDEENGEESSQEIKADAGGAADAWDEADAEGAEEEHREENMWGIIWSAWQQCVSDNFFM